MPRRVDLPGASELIAGTEPATVPAYGNAPDDATSAADETASVARGRRSSGRVRHDEKITVYLSAEELLTLERARLSLRSEQSLAVDRGRIVRAAIASALQQFDDHGPDSDLVRRLSHP